MRKNTLRSEAWTLGLALLSLFKCSVTRQNAVQAAEAPVAGVSQALQRPTLSLEPIYRVKSIDGKQAFTTPKEPDFQTLKAQSKLESVAFLAVLSKEWLPGLVPVFSVEKTNRVELRRRSALGQENFTDPLFFCLPLEDESEAVKLAGRWSCLGVRGEGSKVYPDMELTVEGNKVSGRFDQNSDYRFAYITGGTFQSNRLELKVQYIMDTYVLTGDWRDGKMQGVWKHTNGSEEGTWETWRDSAEPHLPNDANLVPLYEWRRSSDDARFYAVENKSMGAEWKRSLRPIGRVWQRTGDMKSAID